MNRRVRLPLQVGTSSLLNFALGFGLIVPAVLLAVFGLFFLTDKDPNFWPLGVGLVLIGVAVYALRRGWEERPCDIVLDEEGLRVESGALHRWSLRWGEVREATVEKFKDGDLLDREAHRLVVVSTADQRKVLAQADDAVETTSLRGICDAICAHVADAKTSAQAPEAAPQVTRCKGCGAVVPPADADDLRCGFCGQAVALPKEFRERVRAAADLPRERARVAERVRKLIDQPGAAQVSGFIALAFLFMALAWPFTGYAMWYAAHWDRLTFLPGLALIALPFLLIADGFFLARWRLVDRRAVGAMAASFAAIPPPAPGKPYGCRQCGGPLPETSAETVLVSCAFCAAENITGLDLRRPALQTRQQSESLAQALATRADDRRYWAWLSLSAIPLLALTGQAVRACFTPDVTPTVQARSLERLRGVTGRRPRPSPDGKRLVVEDPDSKNHLLDYRLPTSRYDYVYTSPGFSSWFAGEPPEYRGFLGRVVTHSGSVSAEDPAKGEFLRAVVSPDQKRAALVRAPDATARAQTQIALAPLEDKYTLYFNQIVPLTGGPSSDMPSWSPTGDRLVFVDSGGIVVASSDPKAWPTSAHRLTDGKNDDRWPSFDPTGQWIAFVSRRALAGQRPTGRHTLFIMKADGQDVLPLVNSAYDVADAAWSPDGWIYFSEHDRIWRVRPF